MTIIAVGNNFLCVFYYFNYFANGLYGRESIVCSLAEYNTIYNDHQKKDALTVDRLNIYFVLETVIKYIYNIFLCTYMLINI